MINPKLNGNAFHCGGNACVVARFLNDPGLCIFKRPTTTATTMITRLQNIPRNDVKPSQFMGRNWRGAKMQPASTFQAI